MLVMDPNGKPMPKQKFDLFTMMFLTVLVAISGVVHAQKFNPGLEWFTIETPNFFVYYPAGEGNFARRVASIAEDVHEVLIKELKWKPVDKTHIVINNTKDSGYHGCADVIPQLIHISDMPLGLSYSDDDLLFLIGHEYTHILHIDTVEGANEVFRKIFGRLPPGVGFPLFFPIFPNAFQPVWLIEGMAMYQGSRLVNNPEEFEVLYNSKLRVAVAEDSLNSISQASTYNFSTWPGGYVVPYLYGMEMYKYIDSTYGSDKVAELSHQYAGQWVPFFVNYSADKILNRNYLQIWKDWESETKKKYQKQIDEIKREGVTPSIPLTNKGYGIANALYSPDGKYIAYTEVNGDEYPVLKLMDVSKREDRVILKVNIQSLSWSPDGGQIAYAKLGIEENFNQYFDIYIYDLNSESERRLTCGLRATYPDFSPDGKKIVFVSFQNGQGNLSVFDLISGKVSSLTNSNDGTRYSCVRWSPDGKILAVVIAPKDMPTDIYLLNLNGEIIENITSDKSAELYPAWSHDGKTLFFSSARGGIGNIYAYRLEEDKIYKVTNVIGSAGPCTVSPDDKELVFSNMSSKGYDLHILNLDKIELEEMPIVQDDSLKREPMKMENYPEHSYSAYPSILPKFWTPVFGMYADKGSTFGAATFWQDALEYHKYSLSLEYASEPDHWIYDLVYMNDQFFPTILAAASNYPVLYFDLTKDPATDEYVDYWEERKTMDLAFRFEFNKSVDSYYELLANFHKERDFDIEPSEDKTPVPATGDMSGLGLSVGFVNVKKYGFSISKTDGREIFLSLDKRNKMFGSDYKIDRYLFKWNEYIPSFVKHNVVALRLDAGISFGDDIPQSSFYLDNFGSGFNTYCPEELYSPFVLRGYPSGKFRGKKAAVGTVEYRFPVRNIEKGYSTWPVFFNRLHGAVFSDYGDAWDGEFNFAGFKTSVGVELGTDLTLSYFLPITFKIGYARGLNKNYGGESQVIVDMDYEF